MKASVDLRLEISQRKALSARQRPRTSPATRPTLLPPKSKEKPPLIIAGSNQQWVFDRHDTPDDKNPNLLLAQHPSLDKEVLMIASTYSQYLQDPDGMVYKPQPSHDLSALPIEKPTKVSELCEKVEIKKAKKEAKRRKSGGGSRVSFSQSMFSGSSLDQNSSLITNDINAAIEEKSDILVGDAVLETSLEEGTIGIAEQAVPPTESIKLSEKDRLFYDMWITSHHDNTDDVDPLNLDLLCQLQTSLTRLDMQHSMSQLALHDEDNLHETHPSKQKHVHFDAEHLESWNQEKIDYIKSITSMALGTFDLLVDEAGRKYPILADIRDAILPMVYHSKPVDEELQEHHHHHQHTYDGESKRNALQAASEKYSKYHTFIDKWFEAFKSYKYIESTRSNLEHKYEAMVQETKQQKISLQQKTILLEQMEYSHEKFAHELHDLTSKLMKKETEYHELNERHQQEMRQYQEAVQKVSTMSKEKEKLNFAVLEGEYKVKDLDFKLADCAATIEKLKKEITDLKKERRELKQEHKDLQDTCKRQGVMIQSLQQKLHDTTTSMVETLQKQFVDFVQFNDITAIEHESKDSHGKEVLQDHEENAVRHRQALHNLTLINGTRKQLQSDHQDLQKRFQQLTSDYDKHRRDTQEYIVNMQQEHKQEVLNANKSAQAVQDNLRKAGLRKEVEKAALNSMLHTTREELKFVRQQLIEDEEKHKEEVFQLTQEKFSVIHRLGMLTEDQTWWNDRLADKAKTIVEHEQVMATQQMSIESKEADISELQQKLEEMEKDHQIRYADLERQLEEETRTLRFQYQDLEFHSNTKQSQQKELLGMLHEEFLQYRNEAVERRQALLQELENQQQKAQVMASYRVVQDVALTADISDAEDEVKGDGMERLRRIGTISTQTSFKNGVIEDEDDGEVRDQQKKKHKKHRSKNSKRKRAHKHRIKKRANSNEFNIHEDNDSSDSEISSSDSGSDSDSALDEDVINEMRIQRAKEQLRRNATFFDKQYKPVEASHFNNPEAWNYFAERLHEERNKFKELLHYLAGEKKKIANEMKKFGMVMEEMKKEMPNLILKQMEGLQDQHMLQLIMQEIQRRVSTVSFPSSFTNTITSTSSFSSTDTASGEAPQNMVPAIIAPSVNRKSSVTAMTELDTKELLQLGRRLSRMMSSSSVVTRKSIRFEDTDRELFPHFEREDSLESESDSHAIDATLSLSRESPTRSSIEIEYIGSERQSKKDALKSLIRSKTVNKTTQTIEDHFPASRHTSTASPQAFKHFSSSMMPGALSPGMRSPMYNSIAVPSKMGSVMFSGTMSPNNLMIPSATSPFGPEEIQMINTALAVEHTVRALFPHRLRQDIETAQQFVTPAMTPGDAPPQGFIPAAKIGPHELSQPFLGYIRRHERAYAREIGLMKVALRECKAYFDRLLNYVQHRIVTAATPDVQAADLQGLNRRQRKLKIRNMKEIQVELQNIQTSLLGNHWMFDPNLFVRKVCQNPFDDPIDVTAQTHMIASYQEVLASERMNPMQNEAIIHALEDLIIDLTMRMTSHGGWRSALYRSDGSMDLEMDISGYTKDEQFAINTEKSRYLQLQWKKEKEEHQTDVKKLQLEIQILQEQVINMKETMDQQLGNQSAMEFFEPEDSETAEIGCNTDDRVVLMENQEWYDYHMQIMDVRNHMHDVLSLQQHIQQAQSAAQSNPLYSNPMLTSLISTQTIGQSQTIQNAASSHKLSLGNDDHEFVSFVSAAPINSKKAGLRPISAMQASSLSGAGSSLLHNKVDDKGKAKKARPWTSSAWRSFEKSVTTTFGQDHHPSSAKSSLEVAGSAKRIERRPLSPSDSLQALGIYDEDEAQQGSYDANNHRLQQASNIFMEMLQICQSLRDGLLGQHKGSLGYYQENLLSNVDFAKYTTSLSQVMLPSKGGRPSATMHAIPTQQNYTNNSSFVMDDSLLDYDTAEKAQIPNQSILLGIGEAALENDTVVNAPATHGNTNTNGFDLDGVEEANPPHHTNSTATGDDESISNKIDQIVQSSIHELSVTGPPPKGASMAQILVNRNNLSLLPPLGSQPSSPKATLPNISEHVEMMNGFDDGPMNAYEELLSKVWSTVRQHENSDMMRYAAAAYDRYKQYHKETKKMKQVLLSLQNSHHIFEDPAFAEVLEKQEQSVRKPTKVNHKARPQTAKAEIPSQDNLKKIKEKLQKGSSAFSTHLTKHITSLKKLDDGEEKKGFKFAATPMPRMVIDGVTDMDAFHVVDQFDADEKKDSLLHASSSLAHEGDELIPSQEEFDDEDNQQVGSKQKQNRIEQSIQAARNHYNNPLHMMALPSIYLDSASQLPEQDSVVHEADHNLLMPKLKQKHSKPKHKQHQHQPGSSQAMQWSRSLSNLSESQVLK